MPLRRVDAGPPGLSSRPARPSRGGVYVRLPDTGYASPPPTQQAYVYNPPRRSGPQRPLTPIRAQRSVNQGTWHSQSDPYARQQSQDQRPRACGLNDVIQGLGHSIKNGTL